MTAVPRYYDPAHDCRDYGGKDNTPDGCRMCAMREWWWLKAERERREQKGGTANRS